MMTIPEPDHPVYEDSKLVMLGHLIIKANDTVAQGRLISKK